MLEVTVEDRGEIVILRGVGRIVRGEEAALLCPAVGQRGREVVLDLSKVDDIDAAGIGALVALQAAGVYLKIANASRAVLEALRATHVDSIFEILAGSLTDVSSTGMPATAA